MAVRGEDVHDNELDDDENGEGTVRRKAWQATTIFTRVKIDTGHHMRPPLVV